ncbi:hypothetical protein N7532_003523 [Penicillium argentinense]|uniref:Alkaline phytoceramidase n=1 Tax=Penicillium argentinense TaxID=1131581 RepID=A0A9W9FMP9_9EURO|nr:uncharacterized protein N7532_003523 [Penicillium argentinense]KAJ5102994.1 hypothetical protein N7532_003523 [Penicillium argentinense]
MDTPVVPFWGPPTSYLNFCEEDYVISRFVAEFINTFSSFVYICYGIYGLLHLRGKPQAAFRSISYLGLIGVGVCSAGYHMTLKYHTQMSDELSMHLLTTPLLYRILTFQATPKKTRIVGIILSTLFTIVMVVHMVMDEFLLHAVSFGLAVYLIATRTLRIIPGQVKDVQLRGRLRRLSFLGVVCHLPPLVSDGLLMRFLAVCFGFGYFVWLIDEFGCQYLTQIRYATGVPVAFLFELHGWWHVFTAIGGYIAVAIVDLITSGDVNKDPTNGLAWPVGTAMRLIKKGMEVKKEN